MSTYIVSRCLSNERLYAYCKKNFWFWHDDMGWKKSKLISQKFDRERAEQSSLTPEQFLSDPTKFQPLDDYEVPSNVLDALEDIIHCKTTPVKEEHPTPSAQCSDAATAAESQTVASPEAPEVSSHTMGTAPAAQSIAAPASAGEESAAPCVTSGSSLDKPLTTLPDNMRPAFDYTGLDSQTVADLHLAENEYQHGKKLAERGLIHMGDAIAIAHDALCGVVAQCDNGEDGACRIMRKARNNQHSEDTFKKWCLSIGITKDSAYRLLQVSALMDGSNPRQQKILEALPPTLLYAVAKPSAPQELVEKVKNGEVSSNKEYQALLKENQQLRTDRVNAMNQAEREKARADKAEAERDKARADQLSTAKDCNRLGLKADREKARADKAEGERDTLQKQLDGSRQVAEAAKLRGDKLKAENDALKRQTIEAVVLDDDESERRVNQKAHDIAEDLAADMTADLREQLEQAAAASAQDARDAYDSILLAGRSITNTAQSIKPLFRKLPEQQREAAINQLVHTLGQIQGEVSKCL